ncbi:hypothetical protein GCM10020256_39700 [Streptomyces thermocoprophilus]
MVPEHRAQVPGYLTDLRTELTGRTDPARPFKVVTEKQLLTEIRRALARQGGGSCAR